MNFTLKRLDERGDGIFSQMIKDQDGSIFCVAAEHSFKGRPKIPNGVYTCKRYRSPHFGYDVFVIDVPGHEFLEIHIGNDPQVESEGCVLLGRYFFEKPNGSQVVTMSRATFEAFMELQHGVSQFQLTVA